MNELLMICILIIGIITIIISNKLLDTFGLKMIFISFSFISLVLSFKHLTLSTLNINSSTLTYCVMYTAICLLLEKDNKKDPKKIINLNFILNILSSLLLYIMSIYTQSLNDTIGINMTNVFIINYRVLIIYPISTFISSKVLLFIYRKVKDIYDNIFISMVTTYMAIGIINLIIINFVSYTNILKVSTIIKILLSTYMVSLIVIVLYSIIITFLSSKKVIK